MWRRIWQLLAAGAAVLVSAAGGWPLSRSGRLPTPLHRRFDQQQRTQPDLWIQRSRTSHRQRDGQRRGWRGGGTSAWDHRPAPDVQQQLRNQASWLIPAALLLIGALLWLRCEPAHRRQARRSAALGQLAGGHGSGLQLARASSTRTTRSPWRPPSARWWAWAASTLAQARSPARRALLAVALAEPSSGRTPCSRRARIGCPGCAPPC